MKKKNIILLILMIVLGIVILITFVYKNHSVSETFINDHDFLYDDAVFCIEKNNDSYEKNENRYHLFTYYHGFGVTKDTNYYYAYLWISEESYYIKDDKIISGSGSSMPYKFTFDKKYHVIKYDIPEDGSYYVSSIREMYPNRIENLVLNYVPNQSTIIQQVKEYYSDLEDTNIYYAGE